jgi:hypothetical protein
MRRRPPPARHLRRNSTRTVQRDVNKMSYDRCFGPEKSVPIYRDDNRSPSFFANWRAMSQKLKSKEREEENKKEIEPNILTVDRGRPRASSGRGWLFGSTAFHKQK